jgi:hypothetical protein
VQRGRAAKVGEADTRRSGLMEHSLASFMSRRGGYVGGAVWRGAVWRVTCCSYAKVPIYLGGRDNNVSHSWLKHLLPVVLQGRAIPRANTLADCVRTLLYAPRLPD